MRFNTKTLLIAMAMLSGLFATLVLPQPLAMFWTSCIVTALRVWLLAAVVMLIYEGDRARAFWLGVLISGCGWLLVHSKAGSEWLGVQSLGTPTSYLLTLIGELASGRSLRGPTFVAVGESGVAFLFSLAGGRFATWAYDRREQAGRPRK